MGRNNKIWIKVLNPKQIILYIDSQQRSRNSVITKIHNCKKGRKGHSDSQHHRMDQIVCKAVRKKLQRGFYFPLMWCCITGQYILPLWVEMSMNIHHLRMRQLHSLKTCVTNHTVMQPHISVELWPKLYYCRSLKTHNMQWVSNLEIHSDSLELMCHSPCTIYIIHQQRPAQCIWIPYHPV